MANDITGRADEKRKLTERYKSIRAELVAVYGRRRVGFSVPQARWMQVSLLLYNHLFLLFHFVQK